MQPVSVHIIVDHMSVVANYSGTCLLWTPWDQPKVSRLSRCPSIVYSFYYLAGVAMPCSVHIIVDHMSMVAN